MDVRLRNKHLCFLKQFVERLLDSIFALLFTRAKSINQRASESISMQTSIDRAWVGDQSGAGLAFNQEGKHALYKAVTEHGTSRGIKRSRQDD